MSEDGLAFTASARFTDFELEAQLHADPGETLVLAGPSGAGKTTCLRIVAGLVRPDRGRVTLGGSVLLDTERGVDLSPERRHIGLAFQDHCLFPHLSVRRNVAYGPRARGRSASETATVVDQWLDRLGLLPLADRAVRELSGGQAQRVALARALASDARALLLDEPLRSLDPVIRTEVRGELVSFLAEVALPTIVVVHDPVDARVFGGRIVVLEAGRVTHAGTVTDFWARPRTPFAAELAGLNLYRARLAPGHGLREARVGGMSFHVLSEATGDVWIAFSPADVVLSAGAPAGSAQNHFAGKALDLLPLGDRVRVRLDVGVPLTAEVTPEAAAELGLAPGRPLWASVKATAIRVYV